MKKYMTLLTSLCLTVLAFAGNDFLVKRFEESIGPGNEGRVEAFSRFINATSVNYKTDVVQQRLIGYRYNEWLEGDWSTEDTLRMTYGGTRGATYVGNAMYDVLYDLAGDGAGVVNEQRITNTWDDVAVIIKFRINCCSVDRHFRVLLMEISNALWAADQGN